MTKQNTDNNPLVSVVTPVLNGIKYLDITVRNVLDQDYVHTEHVFVDAGSTDGSLELLKEYQSRYPERFIIIEEFGKGIGTSVNIGLSRARGDILTWLDSDDLYEPNALSTVVDFFSANPAAQFLYGGCNMIDESGEIIARFITRDFELPDALYNRHHIYLSSVFYRRKVIDKVGGFNGISNDLDFYVRVYQSFPMHRINRVLSNWRNHSDSISHGDGDTRSKIRKEKLRQDCMLCIKYTRRFFAPRCLRYYVAMIRPLINFLRPVMGPLYSFINNRLELDYYPFEGIKEKE
ncbi:glycosyltransferase [Chloroflexota bacterium]